MMRVAGINKISIMALHNNCCDAAWSVAASGLQRLRVLNIQRLVLKRLLRSGPQSTRPQPDLGSNHLAAAGSRPAPLAV